MRTGTDPTDPAVEGLFAPLVHATAIVAAVSGGPDSIALMGLLAGWARGGLRPTVTVATVDHGLRAEAADEAAAVARAASRLGLAHRTLLWTGPKPQTGLQKAARQARYRLLATLAEEIGASHLVTAHTLDDQAETVLMRMARGSGLSGLAGMRPVVVRSGLRHVRPLLSLPKLELIQRCRIEGWPFIEDPSNTDDRFARSRWRKLMPLLAAEGLTPERIARLAERVRRSDEALHTKACEAFGRARGSACAGDYPEVTLSASELLGEPFEIAVRGIQIALEPYGRASEFVRLERIEACTARLSAALAAGESLRLTLAGAVLSLDRNGALRVTPEPSRRRGRYPRLRGDAAASPHSLGKGEGHA